jgi:hypothetical protein
MRRALALAAFIFALIVPQAVLAAPPTNAQLAARLKALEAKVAKQEKTIKTLTTNLNEVGGLAVGALAFAACGLAITADAVQGQFGITDQIAVNTPNIAHTFFGVQTPVNDQGRCALLQVVRTQVVPPTTAAFSALLSLLQPRTTFDALSAFGS